MSPFSRRDLPTVSQGSSLCTQKSVLKRKQETSQEYPLLVDVMLEKADKSVAYGPGIMSRLFYCHAVRTDNSVNYSGKMTGRYLDLFHVSWSKFKTRLLKIDCVKENCHVTSNISSFWASVPRRTWVIYFHPTAYSTGADTPQGWSLT